MKFADDTKFTEPEINLIPLIDVLLVIIIFLILTTTYDKYAEVKIELPTSAKNTPAERAQQVEVFIDAAGAVAVNDQPIRYTRISELQQALGQAASEFSGPVTVVINADANAKHQKIIDIMQAAQFANLPNISFSTRQQPSS